MGVVLFFTHPTHVPVFLLVLPFVLLGCAVHATTKLVLEVPVSRRLSGGRKQIIALIVSGIVVACSALQSLGEFSLRDFGVVLLLALLLFFYIDRQSATTGQDTLHS